jgi:uncharacterized protein GlcG (DUF336 family)
MKRLPFALLLLVACFGALAVRAQPAPSYGPPINLENAQKVLAAATAEAKKNNWNVVIAIVDPAGHPVLLQRLDDTQVASVEVALQKAKSAAGFRRSTKVFQDAVAGGGAGLRILSLPGAMPIEGGLPIVIGGKIVGAIGVSGVTSEQDGVIAAAGTAAVK